MRRLAQIISGLMLMGVVVLGLAALYLRPTPDLPDLPPLTGQIDRILVEKTARRMSLMQDGKVLRVYPIALGFAPNGDKERQGDGRTPEGIFRIDRRNDRSAFHLSLGLDYPQPEDHARAKAGGYDPGGDIMIHGQPNALGETAVLRQDWTAGCMALSNAEMREVWAVTPIGTLVEIRP